MGGLGRFDPTDPLMVKAVTLDSLVTQPSVVKIDVEAAEVEVLESGRNALRSGLMKGVNAVVTQETRIAGG